MRIEDMVGGRRSDGGVDGGWWMVRVRVRVVQEEPELLSVGKRVRRRERRLRKAVAVGSLSTFEWFKEHVTVRYLADI
jgi:hypothetical protein